MGSELVVVHAFASQPEAEITKTALESAGIDAMIKADTVGGYADPLKMWSLSVGRRRQTIRTLSLQAAQELATDLSGYHMLKIGD